MRALLVTVTCVLCFGCAGIQSIERINSGVVASEFNSITSKYEKRPTFTRIESLSDGRSVLVIERDNYGRHTSGNRFLKSRVLEYRAMIDKYLEWRDIALSRGDMIDMVLGEAETWSAGGARLKFRFYSGNSSSHFLVITVCSGITCVDELAIFYDYQAAVNLDSLLQSFSDGGLSGQPIKDIYK